MSAQEQQQQSQQQQANRGILPSETLNALDYLVDRLNASSGRLPPTATPAAAAASATTRSKDGDATTTSSAGSADNSPLPIRALLVGTNEGVGLSRSLGTAHTASQMRNPGDPTFSHSGSMSEEVLSSIETVWATLASAAPPHVMAASAAGAASNAQEKEEEKKEDDDDSVPPHVQPPHPLLSPLRMGDHVRTVTATYDNCTLMHVHMAPLVVTFVTLPEANVGAIRSAALPLLKVLLEPVRRALVRSRGVREEEGDGSAGASGPGGGGRANAAAVAGGGGMTEQQRGGTAAARAREQQAREQAMSFAPPHPEQQPGHHGHHQGGQMQAGAYGGHQGAMDPVLQQQLYEQQLYEQQQMMLAQQQFQR